MSDPLNGALCRIIQGDAATVLRTLPAGCVHLALTSPPYWKLRAYLDKDHPDKEHELGGEPVPDCQIWARGEPLCGRCYVCRLVAAFGALRRVLRDDGVLVVNLSDSYSGGGRKDYGPQSGKQQTHKGSLGMPRSDPGLEEGSLCGIPWRFALAMQSAGWVLRSSVLWGKLSPMCESVSGWRWERHRVKIGGGWTKETHPSRSGIRADVEHSGGVATGKKVSAAEWQPCPGCKKCTPHGGYVLRKGSWRPTRSHEHVFVFTKGGPYWCDGDAVRTPIADTVREHRVRYHTEDRGYHSKAHLATGTNQSIHSHPGNPLGANLRDVLWTDEGPLFRLRPDLTDEQRKQMAEFLEPYQSDQMADTLLLGPEPASCACVCHPAPDCPVHAGQPGPIYVDRPPPSWKRCTCEKTLHFAAFPSTLCRPFLEAFCPQRCCAECGTGWVRVVEREEVQHRPNSASNRGTSPYDRNAYPGQPQRGAMGVDVTTLGWRPACSCQSQAEPVAGLTLDPFSGTGTLALTARRLGLRALGIELSESYCTLSRCRLQADQPLFNGVTDG